MADEKRITSATGGAKGDKIRRFDQIPAEPMEELAARYGTGSLKYAQKDGIDNWRHGYPFSLSLAALERHLYAFKRGEDYDAEQYIGAGLVEEGEDPVYDENGQVRPGVTHLSAIAWHCFFMLYHLQHNPEFDDRPTTVARRNAEKGKEPPEMTLDFKFEGNATGSRILEILTGERSGMFIRGDLVPAEDATVPEWKTLLDEVDEPIATRPPAKPDINTHVGAPPGINMDSRVNPLEEAVAQTRQAHQAILSDWHNRPTTEPAPVTNSVSGRWVTGELIAEPPPVKKSASLWAQEHGINVRDWDGIAPTEVVTEKDFFSRIYGCTIDIRPVVAGFDGSKSSGDMVIGRLQSGGLEIVTPRLPTYLPGNKRPDEWLQELKINLISGDLGDTYIQIGYAEFTSRLGTCIWTKLSS